MKRIETQPDYIVVQMTHEEAAAHKIHFDGENIINAPAVKTPTMDEIADELMKFVEVGADGATDFDAMAEYVNGLLNGKKQTYENRRRKI